MYKGLKKTDGRVEVEAWAREEWKEIKLFVVVVVFKWEKQQDLVNDIIPQKPCPTWFFQHEYLIVAT